MEIEKFYKLYRFLELNGIKPNITIEQAKSNTLCCNCQKEDTYPLALCDLSETPNVFLRWGYVNLSDAKIYSICLSCLELLKNKRNNISFFYTDTVDTYIGVETIISRSPVNQGVEKEIFISSEESGIYKEIKENPEFMAGHYFVERRLYLNQVRNLETHIKDVKENNQLKIVASVILTAIVVWYFF